MESSPLGLLDLPEELVIEILERLVRDGSSKINPTGNVQRDASAGHYASFGAYDDLRPSNDPQATANYEHNSRCQGVRSVLGDSDARREIAGSSRRSARAIQLPSWRILPGTLREDADDGRVGVVEATAPSPACSLGSPESPSRPSSSRSTSSPRASGACQSHAPLSSGSSCSTVSDSPPPASRPRVRLDGGALDQLLDLRRVSKVFDRLIVETPSLWRHIDISELRRIRSVLTRRPLDCEGWERFARGTLVEPPFSRDAAATSASTSPLTIVRASNGDLRVSPELDPYLLPRFSGVSPAWSTRFSTAPAPTKRRRFQPPPVLERLLPHADELVLETNDLLDEIGLQRILSQTHPTFEDQGQAADKGRLQSLTISSFRYGTSSGLFWPVLAALAHQPQLKRLSLHGDLSIYLGRLSRLCPVLEHLDLSHTRVMDIWTYTWQDQDLVDVARVIEIEDRRMFPRLRTLNLAHCFLDTWGVEPFLRRLPLPDLEEIDLSGLADLQFSHLMGLRVATGGGNSNEDAGQPTKLRRVILKDLDWLTEADVDEMRKHWLSQRQHVVAHPPSRTVLMSRLVHGLNTPPEDEHLLSHFPKQLAAARASLEIVVEHNAKLRSDDEEGYRDYIGRISSPAIRM